MDQAHPLAVRPLAAACLLSVFTAQTQAAGFQLIEQSVSGMGAAYAGAAATAEDASTVYFNPAGLTHLEEPQAIQPN